MLGYLPGTQFKEDDVIEWLKNHSAARRRLFDGSVIVMFVSLLFGAFDRQRSVSLSFVYLSAFFISLVTFVVAAMGNYRANMERAARRDREKKEEKLQLKRDHKERVGALIVAIKKEGKKRGIAFSHHSVFRSGYLPTWAGITATLPGGSYLKIKPRRGSNLLLFTFKNIRCEPAEGLASGAWDVIERTVNKRMPAVRIVRQSLNIADIEKLGFELNARYLIENLLRYDKLWQEAEMYHGPIILHLQMVESAKAELKLRIESLGDHLDQKLKAEAEAAQLVAGV